MRTKSDISTVSVWLTSTAFIMSLISAAVGDRPSLVRAALSSALVILPVGGYVWRDTWTNSSCHLSEEIGTRSLKIHPNDKLGLLGLLIVITCC